MTMSTFHGLEVARKALFAQQRGLYTTGHNIANVNTDGYSRQRSNFATTTPYPPQTFYKPKMPGQMGTGVQIDTVQRVRDQFLDFQYRIENSRASYWASRGEALSRMEELLNEPTDNGLSKTIDRFWQSLQDLANNVDNTGARAVVAQRGLALAETFNHLSRSLQSIQMDLKDQIDVSVKDINSLLRQINAINEQVVKIEPHGLLPNDLYDERDRLLDELSQYVNIKVHYSRSSEGASDIADGIASIEILDDRGFSIDNGVFLIDVRGAGSIKDAVNELRVEPEIGTGPVTKIGVAGYDGLDNLKLLDSIGSLGALVESYGYMKNGEVFGEYPNILSELDKMAYEFASLFNEQHGLGIDMNGNQTGTPFFILRDGTQIDPPNPPGTPGMDITNFAELITVNELIIKEPDKILAGIPGEGSQNANNALALSKLFDEDIAGLNNTSIRNYFMLVVGELGVRGQEAKRMKDNTDILRAQVDDQRMSVTAVSLDEEMSDLIKFQHAYNAAARNMTAIDELIDRIINNMGLVGR